MLNRKIYCHFKLTIIILVFFCYGALHGEESRHFLILDYVPLILPIATDGAGLGLSYEYQVNHQITLGGSILWGLLPVNTGGSLTMEGTRVRVQYFPFSSDNSGLAGRSGLGIFHLGASGEKTFGGLESHFILFYAEESVGWRFYLSKNKIRFFLQPEFNFIFVFPGVTGSGYKDNLTWTGTGLALAVLHPNLIVGINF